MYLLGAQLLAAYGALLEGLDHLAARDERQ